jgi:hypothetical protein
MVIAYRVPRTDALRRSWRAFDAALLAPRQRRFSFLYWSSLSLWFNRRPLVKLLHS